MAIQQNVTKYKDVYTLSNEGVTSFSYFLFLIDCGERLQINTGSLLPSSVIVLPIVRDGIYELELADDEETTITKIVFRKNLLISIAKSIKKSLCDCKCKDCDCEEKEISCNLHKMAFYMLANPEYNLTLQELLPYFECILSEDVECTTTNEFIYGKINCNTLEKNLIVLYYLTIYLHEARLLSDEIEKDYLDQTMKYRDIQKCIKKMGIFINLEELISGIITAD